MARVKFEGAEGKVTVLQINENLPVVTIGRNPGNTLRIVDPSISRAHARIVYADPDCLIEDLGSANGSFVNGANVVGLRVLEDGDVIRCGDFEMSFEAGPRPPATSESSGDSEEGDGDEPETARLVRRSSPKDGEGGEGKALVPSEPQIVAHGAPTGAGEPTVESPSPAQSQPAPEAQAQPAPEAQAQPAPEAQAPPPEAQAAAEPEARATAEPEEPEEPEEPRVARDELRLELAQMLVAIADDLDVLHDCYPQLAVAFARMRHLRLGELTVSEARERVAAIWLEELDDEPVEEVLTNTPSLELLQRSPVLLSMLASEDADGDA